MQCLFLCLQFLNVAGDGSFSRLANDDPLFMLQLATEVKKRRITPIPFNNTIASSQPHSNVSIKSGPLRGEYKMSLLKDHHVFLWSGFYGLFVAGICVALYMFRRLASGAVDLGYMLVLCWGCLYIWTSGTLALVSKSAMAPDAFAYPFELILCRSIGASILSLMAYVVWPKSFTKFEFVTTLPKKQLAIMTFWLAVPPAMEGMLKLISFQHASLAFTMVVSRICLPFVYLAAISASMEKYVHAKMWSLCLVCIFSVIAAHGDLHVDHIGAAASFGEQVTATIRILSQEYYLKGPLQIDPLTLSLIQFVFMTPWFLVFFGWCDFANAIPALLRNVDLFFVQCLTLFLTPVSGMFVQRLIPVGELLLLSLAKVVILFAFSWLVYGDSITLQQGVGYYCSILVFIGYALWKEQTDKPIDQEERVPASGK